MGIDPASFWANLYLYHYESKYRTNLKRTDKIRGRRFHSTFRFIDDLSASNNGGKFGKTFLKIYTTGLELKVECNGIHATVHSLNIYIDEGNIYKMMFYKWDAFNFHIVRKQSLFSSFLRIDWSMYRMINPGSP